MKLASHVVRILVILIAILFVTVLIAVGTLYYQAHRAPGGSSDYVAMGSSFAAGPGVGVQASGSPSGCLRSTSGYPSLVAKALDLGLTDVTCSGATSLHVLDGGQMFLPPQVDALRPHTQLVTVTIGGNDVGFLGNSFSWTCQNDRDNVPLIWRMGVCRGVMTEAQVDAALEALPGRLDRLSREVRRRSPKATLVYVDYLTFLPEQGSCPDRLPLTAAQLTRAHYVEHRLAEITAHAAKAGGAILVPASQLSKGHDVCSADPWVFGKSFPSSMLSWGPMPFHPNQKGMDAMAKAVVEAVQAKGKL
ncbi:MAG TPA: SGNH/GDSL hydrolase family protein [Sphingobium sp.]|uniref:SGNH/GDSL hydrolase family protein n=1 Tax=Sphingobium sp. TaxID=1912891 RepID=UPI002ED1A368